MKSFSIMSQGRLIIILLLSFLGIFNYSCTNKSLIIKELSCEYRNNPLGIDNTKPRLGWILESDQRGQKQTAYQIIVAGSIQDLEHNEGVLWNSGKVDDQNSVNIVYEGLPLISAQKCYWKLRVWDNDGKPSEWSRVASFEMALLDKSDWGGNWIFDGKEMPKTEEELYEEDPNSIFRKEFEITKKIKTARLYITGLGYYESYLNGERIGDHMLDPGFTDFSKRVLYSTYDITSMLDEGTNCIGIMLGNGWYNPLSMRMWGWLNLREHMTIGRPRTICQLNIEYSDGSLDTIVTDESWKVGRGPLRRNNIYLGEFYDARLEQEGWNKPGFNVDEWAGAMVQEEPLGKLQAQYQPPVRISSVVKPIAITEPKPGVFIFDMGINFAGWVEMKVNGEAGTEVNLRFGELLYPNPLVFKEDIKSEEYKSSVYPGALNVLTSCCGQIKPYDDRQYGPGAPNLAYQGDIYILKGKGEEIYRPRFTFHCFRYVEITGFPGTPTLDHIRGYRLNSDIDEVGSFSCSNPLFNKIYETTVSTVLSNIFSVQSDCSHRERFQYGGEITPTSEAIMFSFDMSNFYAKTVRDWGDAVRPGGWLTEEAPFNGVGDMGYGGQSGPIGWGKVHPLLLCQLYQYYGNRQLMEEQYEISRNYVDALDGKHPDHIVKVGIGDHLSVDPNTVTWGLASSETTAHYFHCATMVSQMAEILGNTRDAQKYSDLANKIREAFLENFLKPGTGQFANGTQTSQAFALNMGLVPENEYRNASERLVQQILDEHDGHLSTGTVGTKHLLRTLDKIGRNDVAYTIVNQKTYPGWGYMLENGATSLWERWIGSDNVYSNCHPAFGSVNEWFIKSLSGIRPDNNAVGFDRIIIKPYIAGELTWVRGQYKSIHGLIVSNWKKEDGKLIMNIVIPVNTTAKVYLPSANIESIKEGRKPAVESKGLSLIGEEDGSVIIHLEPGTYSFVYELDR